MVRRAYANGDIYPGTYEGWYCPNEGFKATSDLHRDRDRACSARTTRRAAPVADRAQLVLPPVGLPGPAARATTRRTPTSSSPTTGATRCWASSARASRTSRSAARARRGASRSRSPRTARRPSARTARGTPRRASIYVWFDALINYITGAGFPDDPEAFAPLVAGRPARHRQGHRPVPHDLLAGHAVVRGHRGCRATSGSTAGCSCRRRADEQEPRQLPRPACGGRGVRRRRRPLRDAARGRLRPDTECRWDSFVRRYNADLANDFGNLVNRTRLDGQPLPRRRAAGAATGRRLAARRGLGRHARAVRRASSTAACSTTRSASCGSSWAARTRPSTPSSRGRSTRQPRRATRRPAARLRGVLGDLVEACRLVGLAVAPFMPVDRAADPRAAGPRLPVRRRRQRRPAILRAARAGAPTPGRAA